MKWIITLILLISTLVANEQVKLYKPSFDCQKVENKSIGYQICTDEKLSRLDVELSTIYTTLKKSMPEKDILKELMIDKISFLTQRDKCKETKCIENIYQNQIHTLIQTYELYRLNKIYEILKRVDPSNFIHTNNRKNPIFTNQLQKLIKNKKKKYITFENNYLFTLDNHKLNTGLYCANNTTGELAKIEAGFIKTWQEFKEKDSLKILTLSNSGKKGLGYTEVSLLKVNSDCTISNKTTILEYNYDMESGLCGREELNLEKSADIKKFEFDIEKKLLKIDIQEQQCSSKKISNKSLLFDISTEKLIK